MYFFDNQNILRCGGRLQFSDLPENSKNPILLPKQSHFSHFIILFSHLQTKHRGIKDTVSQVHSRYWIISLLPKQSHFSHLILLSHLPTKHGGIKDTISQVRSKYWIISIRQLVKSIIKRCFLCQRFESKPYRYPPSGSLPPYRSKQSLPFETTGVDYLGPVLVKPIFDGINSNFYK